MRARSYRLTTFPFRSLQVVGSLVAERGYKERDKYGHGPGSPLLRKHEPRCFDTSFESRRTTLLNPRKPLLSGARPDDLDPVTTPHSCDLGALHIHDTLFLPTA